MSGSSRYETERRYRRANLTRYAELQRLWRARNPRENLIMLARARAKRGGFPCTVVVDDIIWPTHCPVFGLELDYNTTPTGGRNRCPRANFATLDRRDPTLGYIPGNTFVLSYQANRLKQDATAEQLQAILRYMTPKS